MATSHKGGIKKVFKGKKEYKAHLRSMTIQDKSNHADGSWDSNHGPIHQMVYSGYHFNKKHVAKPKKG